MIIRWRERPIDGLIRVMEDIWPVRFVRLGLVPGFAKHWLDIFGLHPRKCDFERTF